MGKLGKPARALALSGLLVTVSGCWLHPGYGPERHHWDPFETVLTTANVGDLQPTWTLDLPTGVGSQPLVTGSTVFVGAPGSADGESGLVVQAADRTTGAPLWRRVLPAAGPTSGGLGAILSVEGGEVLTLRAITAGGSTLEKLDAGTGATLAAVQDQGLAHGTAVAVDDEVVAYRALGTTSTSLVVRDRDTLVVRWTAPLSGVSPDPDDPVLIQGDRIYVGDRDASGALGVRAYDRAGCGAATCDPVWTAPLPAPDPGMEVGSYSGQLRAVSPDGRLLLRRPWEARFGPFTGEDLVALSAEDGAPVWEVPLLTLAGVAVAGDTVVAAGQDPTASGDDRSILALSSSTGAPLWRADEPAGLDRQPVVAGDVVYVPVGTGGIDVATYDVDGCGTTVCAPIAVVDTGPAIGGVYGVSVTIGTVFVSKAGPPGRLVALTPGG